MSLSKSLQDIVECPVCKSVPRRGPFPQCVNGHIVCVDCRDELHDCPICRDPFSTTRNLTAERVLELVTFPCNFEDHGCTIQLAGEARYKHEKICPFREVQCPVSYCREMTSMAKLANHTYRSHVLTTIGEESFSREIRWNLVFLPPIQIHFKGSLFFAVSHKSLNTAPCYHFWVYIVDTPDVAERFKFTLTFKDNRGSELKFTDTVFSLDTSAQEIVESKANCVLTEPLLVKFQGICSLPCQIRISEKY